MFQTKTHSMQSVCVISIHIHWDKCLVGVKILFSVDKCFGANVWIANKNQLWKWALCESVNGKKTKTTKLKCAEKEFAVSGIIATTWNG